MKFLKQQHQPGPDGEKIGEGSVNSVFATQVAVSRYNTQKTLGMTVRRRTEKGPNGWEVEDARDECLMRDRLQAAGVSVIPTYRLDEETGDLYMTDLRRGPDGRRRLVLGNTSPDVDEASRMVAEGAFQEGIANQEAFLESLWSIIERASNGARVSIMNSDAFFITVDPETREASVLVGDYKHVFEKKINGVAFTPEQMFDNTLQSALVLLRKAGALVGISQSRAKAFFEQKRAAQR